MRFSVLNKKNILWLAGCALLILAVFFLLPSFQSATTGGVYKISPYISASDEHYFLYRLTDKQTQLYFVTDKEVTKKQHVPSSPELVDTSSFWSPSLCAKMPVAVGRKYLVSQLVTYNPGMQEYGGSLYVFDLEKKQLAVVELGKIENPIEGVVFLSDEKAGMLVQKDNKIFMRTITVSTGSFVDSFFMNTPLGYVPQKMTPTASLGVVKLSFIGVNGSTLFFDIDVHTQKMANSSALNAISKMGNEKRLRIILPGKAYAYGEIINTIDPAFFELARLEDIDVVPLYVTDEKEQKTVFLNGYKQADF